MPPFASHMNTVTHLSRKVRWQCTHQRALELTQFRVCPLCRQSLCHLTTQLWLSLTHSNRRVWAQKTTTENPLPHSAFFGRRKFREKTKHPSILVFWPLDLPLKGRAVSWWLGQNHCGTRRLESIYIFIKNMEDNMVWILGYKHERQ